MTGTHNRASIIEPETKSDLSDDPILQISEILCCAINSFRSVCSVTVKFTLECFWVKSDEGVWVVPSLLPGFFFSGAETTIALY